MIWTGLRYDDAGYRNQKGGRVVVKLSDGPKARDYDVADSAEYTMLVNDQISPTRWFLLSRRRSTKTDAELAAVELSRDNYAMRVVECDEVGARAWYLDGRDSRDDLPTLSEIEEGREVARKFDFTKVAGNPTFLEPGSLTWEAVAVSHDPDLYLELLGQLTNDGPLTVPAKDRKKLLFEQRRYRHLEEIAEAGLAVHQGDQFSITEKGRSFLAALADANDTHSVIRDRFLDALSISGRFANAVSKMTELLSYMSQLGG